MLIALSTLATAEAKYVLKDKAKEAELGDSLVNILGRAKQRKLFDGVTIYFTPNIEPAVKTLQKIATSSNAIVSWAIQCRWLCEYPADPS